MKTKLTLALVIASASAGWSAPATPSVETLKQVLTARLVKLIPTGISERQVLYQDVRAGRSSPGYYPFQVTALIRDYEPGYPPNHYYGNTCVSRLDQVEFTLQPDNFGGWNVQGAMTPPLDTKQCKPNPAAGVSSIPVSTLTGTQAATGNPAPPPAATNNPPAGGGGGGAGKIAMGSYECWYFSQARLLMNFTTRAPGQYVGSDGKPGTYTMDANGRVTFHGGALDGILPAGFYAVYYEPQGLPTVSFRNSGGTEVEFCQKAR